MGRALLVAALLVAVAGCAGRPAVPSNAMLAGSDAVKALRADTSSYRIIYHPPVDLAKHP